MKMVMVVVPSNSAENVLDALVNAGHTATFAETRGGMLRQSQYSLFIALEDHELNNVVSIINTACHTHVEMKTSSSKNDIKREKTSFTADIGGAVVFVWDLEKIEML